MSRGIITNEQRQNQVISRLKNENAFLWAELKKRDEQIVRILADQANKLKPAFEDLLKNIRQQPAVHMDETGWNIAFHDAICGNYIWTMTGADKSETDVVYAFGKNRGMGNAKILLGDKFTVQEFE